jgi:hypothetical protein
MGRDARCSAYHRMFHPLVDVALFPAVCVRMCLRRKRFDTARRELVGVQLSFIHERYSCGSRWLMFSLR